MIWNGWGGSWFGWLGGDNFWEESREAILTILGIVTLFLLLTKICYLRQSLAVGTAGAMELVYLPLIPSL